MNPIAEGIALSQNADAGREKTTAAAPLLHATNAKNSPEENHHASGKQQFSRPARPTSFPNKSSSVHQTEHVPCFGCTTRRLSFSDHCAKPSVLYEWSPSPASMPLAGAPKHGDKE